VRGGRRASGPAIPECGQNTEIENFSTQEDPNDNRICKQILELDQAIRVAAFIEGAEVTGYAETARTKNVLSQSGDLRKKLGFWVSVVIEMARPIVRRHRACLRRTQRVEDGYSSRIREKVSWPVT